MLHEKAKEALDLGRNLGKDNMDIVELYNKFEQLGVYDAVDSAKALSWIRAFLGKSHEVLELIGSNARILDVGTGMSVSLISFIREFPNAVQLEPIVSIDYDKKAISLSKSLLSRKKISDRSYQLVVTDVCSSCLTGNSFDLVICVLALHDINKQGFALYEMLECCRQEGFLILVDSSSEFVGQFSKHSDEAVKKRLVRFVDSDDLDRALKKILPLSSIAVQRFQDDGYRVGKTTQYFLCTVRKTENVVREIEGIQEFANREISRLLEEFNTRLRQSRTNIESAWRSRSRIANKRGHLGR